jgi:hypothetical protein
MPKTAVHAELPQELVTQARQFVAEGWVAGFDELLAEALRRFMESHATVLTEEFVMEDVKWGLRGSD